MQHAGLDDAQLGPRLARLLAANSPLPAREMVARGLAPLAGAEAWLGRAVIVPAVLPCGECDLCRRGLTTICRSQKMPGNDIQGGFGSHIVVPARGLCACRAAGGRFCARGCSDPAGPAEAEGRSGLRYMSCKDSAARSLAPIV